MMTKDELKQVINKELGNYKMIVVSNREPYIHTQEAGKIKVLRPSGGAVTALDPVMRACGGIWIAHGSGNADRKVVDEDDRIRVPTEDPRYTLRRLWLSKDEERGYYYGFSNEALWPLSHIAYTRPIFREKDWQMYKQVNKKFADAILEEKTKSNHDKLLVWIQDYHLVLVAKYIKEKSPDIICAYFWHIPWPNPEVFRICPFKKEIIEGFLANDLVGFHIRYHCDNFIETVEREVEAKVDKERNSIIKEGHECLIRAFPISVDFKDISELASSDKIKDRAEELRKELSLEDKIIFLGCDRIDYTKGIPERFIAFDRFLDKYPEYKEKVVFIQIGAISRILIQAYKDINSEIKISLNEIALNIHNNAIKLIQRSTKTGRVYTQVFRRNKKGRLITVGMRGDSKLGGNLSSSHKASAGGESPATDTGNLVGKIVIDKATNEGDTAFVSSNAKYSRYLEEGTKQMKARPFMEPALEQEQDRIDDIVVKNINKKI